MFELRMAGNEFPRLGPWMVALVLFFTGSSWGQPELGPRLGVRMPDRLFDLGTMSVRGADLLDYTFATAPTDWIPGGGVWELTNRYQCDQRWSFYGGISRNGAAVTWNKRHFAGDVVVEVYAAFKHGLAWNTPWSYRPSDLNIILCGDGRNLSSGYNFIFSGDQGRKTMIWRGERVLAATEEPRFLTPSFADSLPMEHFHRRWWRLEARREGNRLGFFIDGERALEVEDPDPLPDGQVGLWTAHNGIMIARVRIAGTSSPSLPRGLAEPGSGANRSPQPAPLSLVVTSPTHPAIRDDFEAHPGAWKTGLGEDRVDLRWDSTTAASGRYSLRITNATPGGKLEVRPVAKFDAVQMGHLSFDYRITPDVKVNLYLRVKGRDYEIGFTGPSHSTSSTIFLGQIADVVADGQWHHAAFNLLNHLRNFYPLSPRLAARRFFFGNQHDEGYLQSGLGGNYGGSHYFLDNFQLAGAGGHTVRLLWHAYRAPGSPTRAPDWAGFSYVFDSVPTTLPDEVAEGTEAEMTYEGVQDGQWYFHVRAQGADGTWGPATHFPVRVDNRPPVVASPTPSPGSRACPLYLSLTLEDAGAGVDPRSLQMEVADQVYDLDHEALTYDAVNGCLRLNRVAAGLHWTDGEEVRVRLREAQDRLGHGLKAPYEWTWTMDYTQDTDPPQEPHLFAGSGGFVDDTFEYDLGEWETYGGRGGAHLERTTETAAEGRYSLKLTCRENGSVFAATVRKTPFDAGRHRIVSFDYKVPPRLRVDFVVMMERFYGIIQFTDTDPPGQFQIGAIPGVVADGQWHHAEFNLYDFLCRARPDAPSYLVKRLLLSGKGAPGTRNHPGNYAGTTYFIDNFQILPVVGPADQLHWTAVEATEIVGASVALSPTPFSPERDPEEGRYVAGTAWPLTEVPRGWVHFRACLQDATGHVSPPVFTRAWMDPDAPQCGSPIPPDGARAAPPQIRIPLHDGEGSGIDPSRLVLEVQGIDYTIENRPRSPLRYDPHRGFLIWDGRLRAPEPVLFPDGTTVTYRLKEAADYAGNRLPHLPPWTFTMDYRKDRQGPVVAVSSVSHPSVVQDTFETGLEGWSSPDDSASLTRDATTAASGEYSMKITNARIGGPCEVRLAPEAIKSPQNLVMSFDYRIPPDVRINLLLQLAIKGPFNGWRSVGLTDSDSDLPSLGNLPDIQADDQWHHVEFDWSDYLSRDPRARGSTVTALGFGDRGRRTNPQGASFYLDNVVLTRRGRGRVKLSWDAVDETGIAGYNFVLDEQPGTDPPEEALRSETQITFPRLGNSRAYFHIRARDGAGNWGPVTHYLLRGR